MNSSQVYSSTSYSVKDKKIRFNKIISFNASSKFVRKDRPVFYGPKNNTNPKVRFTARERYAHWLLNYYSKIDNGVFKFMFKFDKYLRGKYSAIFYINIFNELKRKYILATKNKNKFNKIKSKIDLSNFNNRFCVLPVEECEEEEVTFGDFYLDEVDEIAEEATSKRVAHKKVEVDDDWYFLCQDCVERQEEEWELVRNPTLLNRLRLIINKLRDIRLGLCPKCNVWQELGAIEECKYEYVAPQMEDEKRAAPNIMQPTDSLATTNSGMRTFGERYNNLKDLCRRYQLYWEGVIPTMKTGLRSKNNAFLVFPVIPSGLDLDVDSTATISWNVQRDGVIPIVSSGYRYFRGSMRFRIVFPTDLSANVWIQHRPDVPAHKKQVSIGNDIPNEDKFKNHNYAFYVQSLKVNNIVEIEIPYYQPGLYGILNSKVNDELDERADYVSLGDIAIGFENLVSNYPDFEISVYYSFADDMSYHCFMGFPAMIRLDNLVSRSDFTMVDGQMEEPHGEVQEKASASNVVLGIAKQEDMTVGGFNLPCTWTRLSSTEQNPRYQSITDRYLFWQSFEWNVSDNVISKQLFKKRLPVDFMKDTKDKKISLCSVPMFVPFTIHQYWKGDIEVKIQVNSNKFQVGMLQASWYYLDDTEEEHVALWCQRPHCLISAGASNEASLYIPFRYFRPYMRTVEVKNNLGALDLGSLRIAVLVPLTTSVNGPAKCSVSVFVRFVNSQFTGLRDSSIVQPQMMEAAGMMAAVSLVDKFIGDKNCDNRPDITPPQMLVPTASHSWCIGADAKEPIHSLRLCNTAKGVGRDECIGVNELDNSVPCSIFGMMKHIIWDSSDQQRNATGTLLASWDVHAQCDTSMLFSKAGRDIVSYYMPPVSVVSSLYQYWRGSIEYRFDIVASQFHTGRLLVAYIPNLYGDGTVTLEQARNSAHVVFSLEESQSFTFVVPYIADKPWWPRRYSGPQRRSEFSSPSKLFIFVLNPLIPMEAVSKKLTIVPYMRAHVDFELAVPVQPSIGLAKNTSYHPPASDITRIKSGYAPWYCGNWRSWGGGNKYFCRYGETSDHVTQFIPGNVSISTDDYLVWQPTSQNASAIMVYDRVVNGKKERKREYVAYIVLWKTDGYVYGIPFPQSMKSAARACAKALAKGLLSAAEEQSIDWVTNDGGTGTVTEFNPFVYHYAQPEMFSSFFTSMASSVAGGLVAKTMTTKLDDLKESAREEVKMQIKRAVAPEVKKITNSIESVSYDIQKAMEQTMKDLGLTVLFGNLMHVLVNPTAATVAVSLANILVTLIQGSLDLSTKLIDALSKHFSYCWNAMVGIASVDPQSESDKDYVKPILSVLFTGVCAMLGVSNVSKPNGYFNLMRDINVTAMVSNNVLTFLKNSTDAIQYYIQYVLSFGNEKAQLEAKLSNSMPDVKAWFKECNYLLDPRLTDRLAYERQLVARVFDACVFGSILVSSGIDKHIPGGKIVWDCYKDIVKLRNKLIEKGVHADVRFECFPLWIAGPPGIGKSYLTANLCRTMLESISYTGSGTMCYYLEPGKKYWSGIQNHPVLVRDDAFQTTGTLLEEEVSSYFSICSSCILNPPMAAVEDKEKRINPLIYMLHSNFTFPEVACCSCMPALYRRRKLLIEADLTEEIRKKYPQFLDSSQLLPNEVENMKHLRFRFAQDPKSVSTGFSEWCDYDTMRARCAKEFKEFYEREQVRFRERMRDMYRLDSNFNDTYIFTDMPQLQDCMSLKEQVTEFKRLINERLVDLDHEEDGIQAYIKQFKVYLESIRQSIMPEGASDEEDDLIERIQEMVDRLTEEKAKQAEEERKENVAKGVKDYFTTYRTRVLEDPNVIKTQVYGDYLREKVYNMTMSDYVLHLGMEAGLDVPTIKFLVEDFDNIDITDLDRLFISTYNLNANNCKMYFPKLKQHIAAASINTYEDELYMCDVEVVSVLKVLGLLDFTPVILDDYTIVKSGEEQALAYLKNYFKLWSQAKIEKFVRDGEWYQDFIVKLVKKCADYDESKPFLDVLSHLEVGKTVYTCLSMFMCVKDNRNMAVCEHMRFWGRALQHIEELQYCAHRQKFFYRNIIGMNEECGECMCENSPLRNRILRNMLFKVYNAFNKEKIDLGLKDKVDVYSEKHDFRKLDQMGFLTKVKSHVECWWSHYISPTLSKIVTFIINILPYILQTCMSLLMTYAVSAGLKKLGGMFYSNNIPYIDPQAGVNYCKFEAPKAGSKIGSVPGARVFAQASVQQRQQFAKKVENNMVILHATWIDGDVRVTRNCRCLMLRERLMLALRHYVEEYQDIVSRFDVTFTLLFNVNGRSSSKVISWQSLMENARFIEPAADGVIHSNYVMLQLPKDCVLFKNILPCIATRAQHENVSAECDMYCVGDKASFNLPIKKENRYIISETEHSSEVVLDLVYSYMRQSKGLCGSVLVSPNLCSGNGGIVGIHVGGSGYTGVGIAEPIYREMFEDLPVRQDPEVMTVPLEPLENSHVDLDSNLIMYGCVPAQFAHKESGKTKYLPSPISGVIYPVKTEPNPLKPNDPRQPPGSHPLRDGCNKLGSGHIKPFSEEDLDEAARDEEEEMKVICKPVRAEVKPLTMQQAVCGDVDVEYFESLEWNSSEGFPLSSMRPSGFHNKKWLFELTEGKFGYNLEKIHDKLQQQIRLRDECFKKNIKPPTIYIDCLKDYRLTPQKCAQPGKTRIFSIAPIQCSLDVRMHMNDWCASIKKNRIRNGVAIGINPDSIEWSMLVSYLFEVGNKIITLDYSNYGPTLMSQVVAKVCDIVPKWFEYCGASSEHVKRVSWLLECDILNPVHLCSNVVYQTINGISSGSPLTGEMNSIPNKLYVKCAWLGIMKEQCPQFATMYYFGQFVRLVVYGDDLIMCVHDSVIDYFNGKTIQTFLATKGIVVTGAKKDQELPAFETIYEATFLKRGFAHHPRRAGVWLAPLEQQSVEECVNWIKDCGNEIEALKACIQSSVDMAYGRGEAYYTEHRQKMIDVLARLNVRMQLKTWNERDYEIFDVEKECDESLKVSMPWVYDFMK